MKTNKTFLEDLLLETEEKREALNRESMVFNARQTEKLTACSSLSNKIQIQLECDVIMNQIEYRGVANET